MLTRGTLVNSVSLPCTISMVYIIVMIPFLALLGCSRGGEGDPVISNLSAPADTTARPSLDLAADYTAAQQARPLPLISQSTDTTDFTSDLTPVPSYTGGLPPGSDSSDDVPMITVTSRPTGVTVRLNWQHSADADTFGYHVYYGKQPAQEAGSCSAYEANQTVDAPPATIAGLEHDTLYYFAVKNFGDSEDACSEEIILVTPPAPT